MSSVKISELPSASALAGTEVLPVVQSGITAKTPVTAVSTYVTDLVYGSTGINNLLTSVAGTDAITAVAPTGLTTLFNGQTYRFVAAATNTGAVTINVSGQGVKAITKNGSTALEASDILIGATVQITYDGTQFQLVSGAGGGAKAGGVIYENALIVTANYTLTTGKNGHSVGPITINGGVAVTIPSGQRWVIA